MGALSKFLGVDNLKCGNCGKDVGERLRYFKKEPSYFKLILWPQYPLFSYRNLKQHFTGDQRVARFCDGKCYLEFVQGGKIKELTIER